MLALCCSFEAARRWTSQAGFRYATPGFGTNSKHLCPFCRGRGALSPSDGYASQHSDSTLVRKVNSSRLRCTRSPMDNLAGSRRCPHTPPEGRNRRGRRGCRTFLRPFVGRQGGTPPSCRKSRGLSCPDRKVARNSRRSSHSAPCFRTCLVPPALRRIPLGRQRRSIRPCIDRRTNKYSRRYQIPPQQTGMDALGTG